MTAWGPDGTIAATGFRRRMAGAFVTVAAGMVAALLYGAGEFGPMVIFGHGDANRIAHAAWQQIPLHAALSAGIAIRPHRGLVAMLNQASVAGIGLLAAWAALLAIAAFSNFHNGVQLSGAVGTVMLLVLYVAALALVVDFRRGQSVGLEADS